MTHLTNKNYKIYGDLPLTIEANKHKSLEPLLDWLRKEKILLEETMLKHGAIRFRSSMLAPLKILKRLRVRLHLN